MLGLQPLKAPQETLVEAAPPTRPWVSHAQALAPAGAIWCQADGQVGMLLLTVPHGAWEMESGTTDQERLGPKHSSPRACGAKLHLPGCHAEPGRSAAGVAFT